MIDISRFKNNKIQVLNVNFQEHSTIVYSCIVFKKENNQLLVNKKQYFNNFQELTDKLNKKIPLVVHYSGKGILHKKITQKEVVKSNLIFNQNINDFYFYELNVGSNVFVSFIRKQTVDLVLNELKQHHIFCVDCSIGPFVTAILNSENDILFSNDFELLMESNKLIDFLKVDPSKIDRVNRIENHDLLYNETSLFASAVNYLFPNGKITTTENTILSSNKKERLYQKLFTVGAAFVVSFFLSSLTISYLLLNNYNQKYMESQVKMIHFQNLYSKMESLKQQVLYKEEILNSTGVYNEKYLTFYINEITMSLPSKIVLNEMNVFPLTNTVKEGKKISMDSQCILVEGQSNSSLHFNDWLKILKKEDWIVSIEIVEYKKVKSKNDEFKLIIKV